jgi:hypothetical protein
MPPVGHDAAITLLTVGTRGRPGFTAWARHLDERVLGPGGWLPDDTSYLAYQREMFVARASPAWVRFGRWIALLVMLGLLRWGDDGGVALVLFLATIVAIGVLSFRIERDVRLAARARRLAGQNAAGSTSGASAESG